MIAYGGETQALNPDSVLISVILFAKRCGFALLYFQMFRLSNLDQTEPAPTATIIILPIRSLFMLAIVASNPVIYYNAKNKGALNDAGYTRNAMRCISHRYTVLAKTRRTPLLHHNNLNEVCLRSSIHIQHELNIGQRFWKVPEAQEYVELQLSA